MPDIKKLIIDLSTTLLAAGIGLVLYRNLRSFHRLVLWQVLLYLVTDIFAITVPVYNVMAFNVLIIMETALLTWAGALVLKTDIRPRWFVFAWLLFFAVYVYDHLFTGGFYYHAAITQGLLLTVVYLLVLWKGLHLRVTDYNKWSVNLLALGMVLYYACSVPYLSLMFKVQRVDPVLNRTLFQYIIVLLASLRYLLIAIAFVFAGQGRLTKNYGRA